MCQDNKFSVCYVLEDVEHIIRTSDENIKIEPVNGQESEYRQDIMLKIRNTSHRKVFLKYVTLWQAEEEKELRIGAGPFEVYRSGRHKNDMPGTFTLGIPDERMKDVLGAMSETGDKTFINELGKEIAVITSLPSNALAPIDFNPSFKVNELI